MAATRTEYCAGLLLMVCAGLSSSLQLTDDWVITQFQEIAKRDAAQDSVISRQEATIIQQYSVINALKEQVKQQQMTLGQLQQESQHQASLAHQNQLKLETEITKASQLRTQLSRAQQDIQQQADNFNQKMTPLLTQVHTLQQELMTTQKYVVSPSNGQDKAEIPHHNESKISKLSHDDLVQPTTVRGKGHAMVAMETELLAPDNTSTSGHGIRKTQEQLFHPRRLLQGGQSTLTSSSDNVAFHAVIGPAAQNVDANDVVRFETVLLNLGGAYHSQQGLFIAPIDGLYIFSASITLSPTSGQSHVDAALMRNAGILGNMHTFDDSIHRDQGSVTVITQLNKGDEIWVKILCCDAEQLFQNNFSSLTGALMFQLSASQ